MFSLKVNGKIHQVDVEPDTPLMWVLRDTIGLTGTKFGCGVAACGACTLHLGDMPVRSCITPISAVGDNEVVTIEGLGAVQLHRVQHAWIEHQVPQCGYCQSGMIMAVSGLLQRRPNPSDEEINESITNICRCGAYPRIRKAIRSLATENKGA
ncbi:MAG: (2Fe-2S)-binding protein [Pseudomonadota bacterium]|nr:(2Fe-2S)-binding protein [Pseudomonadota bacterium]